MSEGAHLTDTEGAHRVPSATSSTTDSEKGDPERGDAEADDLKTDDDSKTNRDTANRDETENGTLTHGAVFEALSNQRRRFVLHYLKQRPDDGAVELADLSAQVTAWERGVDAESLSYADRKNVHTSLSQFHAPKLEELGFVRFDRDEGSVELTDRAKSVNVYMETTSGRELAWGPCLLLVSSVLSAVVFGSLVGVPIISDLTHQSLAVFVAVTSLSTTACFAYDTWTRMRVGHDGPPPEVTDR